MCDAEEPQEYRLALKTEYMRLSDEELMERYARLEPTTKAGNIERMWLHHELLMRMGNYSYAKVDEETIKELQQELEDLVAVLEEGWQGSVPGADKLQGYLVPVANRLGRRIAETQAILTPHRTCACEGDVFYEDDLQEKKD